MPIKIEKHRLRLQNYSSTFTMEFTMELTWVENGSGPLISHPSIFGAMKGPTHLAPSYGTYVFFSNNFKR